MRYSVSTSQKPVSVAKTGVTFVQSPPTYDRFGLSVSLFKKIIWYRVIEMKQIEMSPYSYVSFDDGIKLPL